MKDDQINHNQLQITKLTEQMAALRNEFKDFKNEMRRVLTQINTTISQMNNKYVTMDHLIRLEKNIEEELHNCKNEYLKKDPYKKIIDGLIALVLVSVTGALVALVIK